MFLPIHFFVVCDSYNSGLQIIYFISDHLRIMASFSFFFLVCKLSLAAICCHLLSLVVTRFTTRCQSLSLVVTRCHLWYHLLSFVVTRCTTRQCFYFYFCEYAFCFDLNGNQTFIIWFRSIRSQMFFKLGILKNFAVFTGKHLNWSAFVIKLQALRHTQIQEFSCEIWQIFKNSFLYRTHLVAASNGFYSFANRNSFYQMRTRS